jgi:hypothetical protein
VSQCGGTGLALARSAAAIWAAGGRTRRRSVPVALAIGGCNAVFICSQQSAGYAQPRCASAGTRGRLMIDDCLAGGTAAAAPA